MGIPESAPAEDVVPPGAIVDLRVVEMEESPFTVYSLSPKLSMILRWTAPGDDDRAGQAYRYELRVGLSPLTAENWLEGLPLGDHRHHPIPLPSPAGTPDSVRLCISGLDTGTTYWLALRSFDDRGNASLPSNNVRLRTSGVAAVLADTLVLYGSKVWALGRWVEGDTLIYRYSRHQMHLNDIPVRVRPRREAAWISRIIALAPRFRELLEAGACSTEAANRYMREADELSWAVHQRLLEGEIEAAARLLEESDLYDSVRVEEDGDLFAKQTPSKVEVGWSVHRHETEWRAWQKRLVPRSFWDCEGSFGYGPPDYRRAVNEVRDALPATGAGNPVIMLPYLGWITFEWPEATPENLVAIQAQLEWLRRHHSADGMPEGLLRPGMGGGAEAALHSIKTYSP